jgi:hypothetical protein
MDFFFPDPEGGNFEPDRAEEMWQATRTGAESDVGRDALARRVYKLDYVHNGRDFSAVVGERDAYDNDLIMAIVAFPGLYSIRCRVRGFFTSGEPIIVGEPDVRHVEDFDQP